MSSLTDMKQSAGCVEFLIFCNLQSSFEVSHNHKIKMAIYANQTLRTSHAAMLKLLKEMKDAERISDVKEPMSTMNEIFELQEMYDIKNKEKDLENELKKLGYIN